MKIFLFSSGFVDYTIGLANSLSIKHNVKLYLPENSVEDKYEHAISDKVDFISFNMPRQSSFRNIFWIREVYKSIKNFKPDVIHLQSGGHPLFSLLHPFLLNYKIINTVHDPKLHIGERVNYIRSFFDKISSFFIDEYIVHGHFLKLQLSNSRNISLNKITIINHGDYNLYHSWGNKNINEEKDTILFFGRIWKYKGLDYLIKAQPSITKYVPGARIIIAGRGENIKNYTKKIKDLSMYEIYNYRISNEQMVELFKRTSVVVLPYIDGSQSGVVHLSYSFGKPVIATKVGSIHENIDNYKSGILIEPKDYKMVAASIISILRQDRKRRQMSEFARNLSLTKYSWNAASKETIKLYKKVMGK